MNKLKRIIAFTIFYGFVFSFLHSELGFWDYDKHNHSTHDFCEIVKNTNIHSKILRSELPKLEFNKDICFHCFEESKLQAVHTFFVITEQHLKTKPFIKPYLFNSSFLI